MSDIPTNGHAYATASELAQLESRVEDLGRATARRFGEVTDREITVSSKLGFLDTDVRAVLSAVNNARLSEDLHADSLHKRLNHTDAMLELVLRHLNLPVPL